MVGWHHRLNGHEFEQALGVDDGQGSNHRQGTHFIIVVQSLSHVQLFATPAHQAALQHTRLCCPQLSPGSLLKLMSIMCCSPRGCKESDMTEQLN